MIGPTTHDDPALELRRVVGRLSGLTPERAERPGPDGASPADLVRAELDALAADASARRGDDHREVPVLRPHALGDQLTVLVHEALDAGAATSDVVARLVRLRRSL